MLASLIFDAKDKRLTFIFMVAEPNVSVIHFNAKVTLPAFIFSVIYTGECERH